MEGSMKKSYFYTIIVLVIIIVGGIGLYIATHGNKNASPSMKMPSTSTSSKSVTTDSVMIQNYAFSPANITVKVGTKVTWMNMDSVAHTVTETDGQNGPDSGDISNNTYYSFTFDKPGVYHYHCKIHPEMTGTVTVS